MPFIFFFFLLKICLPSVCHVQIKVQENPSHIYLVSPEVDSLLAFLETSSATNEVAMLRRGMLNTLDIMLKIDMATPADANSKGPIQ